jgi:inner membrane protein
MSVEAVDRSPGSKLVLAIVVAVLLSLPLFMVWMLVYDREQQSEFARTGITEGWSRPQVMNGPLLVIPYRADVVDTVTENGRQVTRTRQVWQKLTLAPEVSNVATQIRPERRHRAIYEVVVYEARASGRARFVMPADLSRLGLTVAQMDLSRAEIRFGLSDPRGLGANPRVTAGGHALRLQPGGAQGSPGFFAWIDAATLAAHPIQVDYEYGFRGTGSLGLAPRAGDTNWRLQSAWPSPSFQGGFLPVTREINAQGFTASYRVGNLALGQSLVSVGDDVPAVAVEPARAVDTTYGNAGNPVGAGNLAQVSLLQPVDLYAQVNRAAKYGFLFIGFTFLAFLMFDVIGGVRVSMVEYLLVGAGLILFFVLLLALAEVIGFLPAYVLAAAAITILNTAYSASVLKSWRRAGFIGALLSSLYAVLYVLLSLEAYSLLIGSLMVLIALSAVMYATRNLNWSGRSAPEELPVS